MRVNNFFFKRVVKILLFWALFFSHFFRYESQFASVQMLSLFRMSFKHTVAAGKNNYPCSRYQSFFSVNLFFIFFFFSLRTASTPSCLRLSPTATAPPKQCRGGTTFWGTRGTRCRRYRVRGYLKKVELDTKSDERDT